MDYLNAPLGLNNPPKQSRLPNRLLRLIFGIFCLGLATVAGWAILAKNPFGGELTAMRPVTPSREPAGTKPETPGVKAAAPGSPHGMQRASSPPPARQTVTIIDGSSGKRQDIVVPNSGVARRETD